MKAKPKVEIMSSLHKLYHEWSDQLQELFRWKRPEHRKVLAWLMVSIYVGKEVCLDRLGLYLPREAKPASIGQQFRRWLKNKAIDPRLIYDPVARRVVSGLRCRRLRIQLDRVQIKQRQNVLMLSVWYHKRAIPLAWLCLPYGRGQSHTRHWQELLDYLDSLLAADMGVIILADREFGSVERLRYVRARGWCYAIRLKGDVEFYDPGWGQSVRWLNLNAIAPAPGARYALTDLRLTKAELFPTHLACAWAVGSTEPWFIATNLSQPIQALKEYARRFGCEELFSDLKKRGFNWENSLIRQPDRFARLILALALLTVLLLAIARQLRQRGADLEILAPSQRPRLSCFQTAFRWLRRRLVHDDLPAWLASHPLGQFI
jgi:Transposase DDE domain